MQLIFRNFPANDASPPSPGEIQVCAGPAEHAGRRDLAALVLEQGPDVLRRGPGTIERIIVRADPSLDDLLAAAFAVRRLKGRELPEGAKPFTRYAALVREGLRPSEIPLDRSLEGIFLAIRSAAGPDLSVAESGTRFAADWSRMEARVWQAIEANDDPFTTPLFGSDFARERAFLTRDLEVFCQDVLRGERWSVQMPGGPPQGFALLLDRPKSLLFKYWSRQAQQEPPSPAYLFLAVEWGKGQWVFSTDPLQRLSLKPLADALQTAESAADAARAAKDGWFDGKPFGHTLVAAPHGGTVLPRAQVLNVVKKWTRARPVYSRRSPWIAGGVAAAALLLAAVTAFSLSGFFRAPPPPVRANDGGDSNGSGDRGLRKNNDGPDNTGSSTRGLFVLSIGISDYHDPKYHLKFADADAREIVQTFKKYPSSRLFETVTCYEPLVNDKATREGIMAALKRLSEDVHQYDLAIVTISGHGAKYNDLFYFLPYDFNEQKENVTGVYWADFKRELGKMPCPVWIVLDTCHSGAVAQEGFRSRDDLNDSIQRGVSEFERSGRGMVVTAACMSGESARERPEWGHGALTLSLLEGLSGRQRIAGRTGMLDIQDGAVSVKELEHYMTKRVQELGNGKQAVVTNQTGNLDLARRFVYQRGE